MNKVQSSNNNMNMEEIMEMNQILKPYQEKSNEVDPDNIKDTCSYIEVIILLFLKLKNLFLFLNKIL